MNYEDMDDRELDATIARMIKYLYVEMFDEWGAFNDMECGGSAGGRRRIVKIPLTPEQCKMIEPRITGNSGKTEYHESVIPLSIQDD